MMRATVDSWVASQSTGGLLPYGFDFLADKPTEPDRISRSNLIRQAGSAYTLAVYNQYVRDPRLEEPIRRVLSAFDTYSLPMSRERAELSALTADTAAHWQVQLLLSIGDSDYYNGEGWLAVAVYCDLHRDDAQAAAALAELDEALIERYSLKPNPYFYHWGAMAAAQRFATTRNRRFVAFLPKQADLFFDRFQGRLKPDANNCADMEGLAATLAVLDRSGEGDGDLAGRIRTWLLREAAKLPKLQIQPGQTAMVLGGEAALRAPRGGLSGGRV